jgi:hypothetical protein
MWTALTAPEEPLRPADEIDQTRGEVEAYFVASGKRLTWSAPRARVRLTDCGEPTPVGVDGAAEHTRRTVFWLAATEERCGEKGGPTAPIQFAVYARSLR